MLAGEGRAREQLRWRSLAELSRRRRPRSHTARAARNTTIWGSLSFKYRFPKIVSLLHESDSNIHPG